jgi:hypothetical protein
MGVQFDLSPQGIFQEVHEKSWEREYLVLGQRKYRKRENLLSEERRIFNLIHNT